MREIYPVKIYQPHERPGGGLPDRREHRAGRTEHLQRDGCQSSEKACGNGVPCSANFLDLGIVVYLLIYLLLLTFLSLYFTPYFVGHNYSIAHFHYL